MDAVDEVAQVLDRAAGVGGGARERVGGPRRVAPRLLDAHQHLDEPLLRAVVQVARDPAALGVRGGDDARPRAATSSAASRSLTSRNTTTAPRPSGVAIGADA